MFSALQDSTLFALFFWIVVFLVAVSFLGDVLIKAINAMLHRSRRASAPATSERIATVRTRFKAKPGESGATGMVFLRGELWTAHCPVELAIALDVGDRVEIERIDGLTAKVRGKVKQAV